MYWLLPLWFTWLREAISFGKATKLGNGFLHFGMVSDILWASPEPTASLSPTHCGLRKGTYQFIVLAPRRACTLAIFNTSGALCLPWTWCIWVFHSAASTIWKGGCSSPLPTIAPLLQLLVNFQTRRDIFSRDSRYFLLHSKMQSYKHTEAKYTLSVQDSVEETGAASTGFF